MLAQAERLRPTLLLAWLRNIVKIGDDRRAGMDNLLRRIAEAAVP
jgi:hypothetical protein